MRMLREKPNTIGAIELIKPEENKIMPLADSLVVPMKSSLYHLDENRENT